MSKASIYDANNRMLLTVDKVDKAIFECLLQHTNGITQTNMQTLLGIKQPTISNRLRKIGSHPFIYGNSVYIISKINGSYQMIKLDDMCCLLDKNATEEEKQKFGDLLNNVIYNFVNKKVFSNDSPFVISDSVILFETKERHKLYIRTELFKLYNKSIYDIVSCTRGLYIILNQMHLSKDQLTMVRNSIISLYENVISLVKLNKLSSRSYVNARKEKDSTIPTMSSKNSKK